MKVVPVILHEGFNRMNVRSLLSRLPEKKGVLAALFPLFNVSVKFFPFMLTVKERTVVTLTLLAAHFAETLPMWRPARASSPTVSPGEMVKAGWLAAHTHTHTHTHTHMFPYFNSSDISVTLRKFDQCYTKTSLKI